MGYHRTVLHILILLASASVHVREVFGAAPMVWSEVTADGSKPDGRKDFGMGFDQARDQIILFGGHTASSVFGDTWIFDIGLNEWTEILGSTGPPARYSFVYALDSLRDRFLVTTGEDSGGDFFNDCWEFNLESQEWAEIETTGTPPAVRYGSGGGASIVNANNLYVTHGFSESRFDDSFALDLQSNEWSEVTPQTGNLPFARCLVGSTVTSDDQLIMFGGCGSGGFGPCPDQETWSLSSDGDTNGYSWTQYATCPAPQLWPSMAPSFQSESEVLLYGGSGGFIRDGEISILNVEEGSWTVTLPTSAESPPITRLGAAMVMAYTNANGSRSPNDSVYLFGGESSSGLQQDLWKLSADVETTDIVELSCTSPFNTRVLHGVLMFLSWGFLLPIGGTVARFGRHWENSLWFKLHKGIQIIGVLFSIGGIIAAFLMVQVGHFLAQPHSTFGIIVVILGIQQPINGFFRPHKKTPRRPCWEVWHKNAGRFAMLLGLVNPFQGLLYIGAHTALIVLYSIWVGALVLFYIVNTMRGVPDRSPLATTCAEALNFKQKEKPNDSAETDGLEDVEIR